MNELVCEARAPAIAAMVPMQSALRTLAARPTVPLAPLCDVRGGGVALPAAATPLCMLHWRGSAGATAAPCPPAHTLPQAASTTARHALCSGRSRSPYARCVSQQRQLCAPARWRCSASCWRGGWPWSQVRDCWGWGGAGRGRAGRVGGACAGRARVRRRVARRSRPLLRTPPPRLHPRHRPGHPAPAGSGGGHHRDARPVARGGAASKERGCGAAVRHDGGVCRRRPSPAAADPRHGAPGAGAARQAGHPGEQRGWVGRGCEGRVGWAGGARGARGGAHRARQPVRACRHPVCGPCA